MQKIIIDTNVIVSALIGVGYPREIIYEVAFTKKAIVCLSNDVFAEYVNVLNRERFAKYPNFVTNAEVVLNKLEELSQKYLPSVKIQEIKDQSDNKFLELGVSAKADYLITGNTNDFILKEYHTFKIVTPQEYITKYVEVK